MYSYYVGMDTKTVTIPREEYKKLQRDAAQYRRIATRVFETAMRDTSTAVVADFKKTGLYTEGFLNDLENGLQKSSYGKA